MPDEKLDDLRRRTRGHALARAKSSSHDASQGVQLADGAGARPLLGRPSTTVAQTGGQAERPAAVHDRDRRARHPLHPREVGSRERLADHHHPRLARLGDRDARGRRPAHRPDGSRRQPRRTPSTSSSRPCPVTASRASRPRPAGTPAASWPAWAELMNRLGDDRATSPRAATRGPASPTRWADRHPKGCSASTSTCSEAFPPKEAPDGRSSTAHGVAGLGARNCEEYEQGRSRS